MQKKVYPLERVGRVMDIRKQEDPIRKNDQRARKNGSSVIRERGEILDLEKI